MPLTLSKQTLDVFFETAAARFPDRPAMGLVYEPLMSYRELTQRVAAMRDLLQAFHITKGDKVVLLGFTTPQWAISFLSVTTLGAVVVPVIPEFPESDIDHIIRHAEAKAVILAAELYDALTLPALDKISLIVNMDDFTVRHRETNEKGFWRKLHDLPDKIKQTLFHKKAEDNPVAAPILEDDPAEILYTSGTTGHSKGVLLTHKNIVTNVLAGAEVLGADENLVLLNFLPLAHAFSSTFGLLAIIYYGASVHFMPKKPTPKALMEALQTIRPTMIGSVPLIFEKIYRKRVMPAIAENRILQLLARKTWGKKLVYRLIGRKIRQSFGGRLEYIVVGGASLNHEVEAFMRDGGLPYLCGYGLSECAPLVSFCRLNERKVGSVGKAIRDVIIKIVNPEPQTGIGEIYIKGPNVMKGYYKNEDATHSVFTPDGWLITGDRGYLDADGFLFIKGRSKNVIIGPSGENIYPETIEEKLTELPEVEEALVYEDNQQIIARIYPDYQHIESILTDRSEAALSVEIPRILEAARILINRQVPVFARIHKVIEQKEPFIKTPTNKIKRGEYIRGYLK